MARLPILHANKPKTISRMPGSVALTLKTIKRRRVEIVAFEQERIVIRRPLSVRCPVCQLSSEMLTVRQAGALAQVKARSIRRWLMRGQAHGVRTCGGHFRVCRNSLFVVQEQAAAQPARLKHELDSFTGV